jgi:hypothetical protein
LRIAIHREEQAGTAMVIRFDIETMDCLESFVRNGTAIDLRFRRFRVGIGAVGKISC